MSSFNSYGPKRAAAYVRVSTDEQGKSGYSIPDQLRELRSYAAREGYRIVEEVVDDGYSGATPNRPGLQRVMELAETSSIEFVLAAKRDRFFRSRLYRLLWDRDLEELGVRLIALNDTGNRFGDAMQDEFAEWEKEEIARRTMAGKLQKAREGKVVGGGTTPNFGFTFNSSRDNYVVDEEKMQIVRRIFHMVGVEKRGLKGIKKTLQAEGIPTPTGNKYWHSRGLREFVLSDVYKPHTYEEIKELISLAVATTLDPEKRYGVWWFNRERITRRKITEDSLNSGGRYREKVRAILKPKEEWIAVPVPDSGIPREVVEAAREAIADNKPASNNGARFWELSGGILRCSACGLAMRTNITRKGVKRYCYYLCSRHHHDWDACPNRKNYRADKIEPQVRDMVYEAMTDPDQLRADLNRMIEFERQGLRGDPDQETKEWLEKLAEVDRMRVGYQEMAAKGLMTFEELGARLEELKNTRGAAARELEALRGRQERIEQMERDRDALLESYAGMAPVALERLTPEERQQVYKMLKLKVLADVDGRIEATGPLILSTKVCTSGSASWRR